MTSHPGIRRASSSDSPVLRVAVAPARTISAGKDNDLIGASARCLLTRFLCCASSSPDGGAASERVRTGTLDADVNELTNQLNTPIEMDELVVAVATGQAHERRISRRVRVRRRRSLLIDEDLGRSADPFLVGRQSDAVLEVEQSLEPALLLGPRHVIVQPRGRRPGPHGEGRGEDRLEADLA